MDDLINQSNQKKVTQWKRSDLTTLFKTLDMTARLTNASFYVIDFFKQQIIHSTPSLSLWENLGENRSCGNAKMSFLSHILDEDKELLKNAHEAYLNLFEELDDKQKEDATLVANYRLDYSNRIYGVALKICPLALKRGKLWLGIAYNTISPYLNKHYATVFGKEIRYIFDSQKRMFVPYQNKHINLTVREHSILTLMTVGLTTEQIAETLRCTPNTVKTNKKRLFKKLNVKSSHEALTIANTYNLFDL